VLGVGGGVGVGLGLGVGVCFKIALLFYLRYI